jgi:hypothetical protein
VATGHQWAIDYQWAWTIGMRLSFTRLRHRDWLRLVPHFCFRGTTMLVVLVPAAASARWLAPHFVCRELRSGLPTLKTHRYVGADTLGLNTLPYRAGYTACRPIDWPFSQKFARGWADVTRRAGDKIFDPYSLLRTSHFALRRKSLLLLDLKCEVTATSH